MMKRFKTYYAGSFYLTDQVAPWGHHSCGNWHRNRLAHCLREGLFLKEVCPGKILDVRGKSWMSRVVFWLISPIPP